MFHFAKHYSLDISQVAAVAVCHTGITVYVLKHKMLSVSTQSVTASVAIVSMKSAVT